MAKGSLAKARKQCGLKHNETYRTPISCTVPLPKVPLVPSNICLTEGAPDGRTISISISTSISIYLSGYLYLYLSTYLYLWSLPTFVLTEGALDGQL